jgi:predicted secreted protein
MNSDDVVRLRVGEQFAVTLTGHGATGYQWLPSSSTDHVEVAAAEAPDDSPANDSWRPGDQVDDHFVVTAVSPGSATVVFDRARLWQRDKVVDQQSYEIVVVEA